MEEAAIDVRFDSAPLFLAFRLHGAAWELRRTGTVLRPLGLPTDSRSRRKPCELLRKGPCF